MIDSLQGFLDSYSGGAWPLQVRGAISLVNSDNERDARRLVDSWTVLSASVGRRQKPN